MPMKHDSHPSLLTSLWANNIPSNDTILHNSFVTEINRIILVAVKALMHELDNKIVQPE